MGEEGYCGVCVEDFGKIPMNYCHCTIHKGVNPNANTERD